VYIIDECHKLSTDAMNAFLKILEDTPPQIYFILCTTNEKSLLPTIIGRCSRHQVSLLTDPEMTGLLQEVTEKEEQTIDDAVVEMIVKSAQGHPRNALTILEQVLATPEKRRLKVAEQAQELETESRELCQALLARKGWPVVSKILKNLKGSDDAESVRRMVLGYMSAVLLNKDDAQAAFILECFEEPFYNIGFPGLVLACYRVIKN
jgi:DNA polymerase III gamma/tau subunit